MAEGRGTGADIARIKLSYSILPPTVRLFPLVPALSGKVVPPRASSALASTPHVIVLCPLLSLRTLLRVLLRAFLSSSRPHPTPLSPQTSLCTFLTLRSRNFVPRFYGLDFVIRGTGTRQTYACLRGIRCIRMRRAGVKTELHWGGLKLIWRSFAGVLRVLRYIEGFETV